MAEFITLLKGDCLHQMHSLAPESIDACVTDPPYGLSFMGKGWDHGVPSVDYWRGVFRVLKPGAHIVAFGGTRTYHRLACAIEDAGFEPRDMLAWLYGCGFPKNRDTALKPALEPIAFMRKPLSKGTVAANVLRWGTGALNIDGCRVGAAGGTKRGEQGDRLKDNKQGFCANSIITELNSGRWPANVVHDGSDEVIGAFPTTDKPNGRPNCTGKDYELKNRQIYGHDSAQRYNGGYMDTGSAARFFYSAKASKADRAGSKHPTVKRVDLMQWLCRLVTPKGGTVLDPFAGTGTTGEAAFREGFKAVLIERESEYQADIERRIARLQPQQERMLA